MVCLVFSVLRLLWKKFPNITSISNHNLGHPGVNLHRVNPNAVADNGVIIGNSNKTEGIGAFFDGDVGVGREGELEDPAEDVG